MIVADETKSRTSRGRNAHDRSVDAKRSKQGNLKSPQCGWECERARCRGYGVALERVGLELHRPS